MAKLFFEDTEILITEKTNVEDGTHEITNKYYIMEVIEKTIYKSTLFSYDDLTVLVSKLKRFNEMYYKIVLFSDEKSSAWQLLVISAALNIKAKRLNPDCFIIVGEKVREQDTSQVSFCKIKENSKVDEVTINFSKLNSIDYVGENGVLLSYDERDDIEDKIVHVLSMYNHDGKLLKNFYEFCDSDTVTYSFELEGKSLKILTHDKTTDKETDKVEKHSTGDA